MAEQTAAIAYQDLKIKAETLWAELWKSGKPVIMVGAATCGRAAGAMEVLSAIKNRVEEFHIDCTVIEVGCMGHCYAEPIVIIGKPGYPPISYGHVNPVVAERLLKEFLLGDDPCFETMLGALERSEAIPSLEDFPRAQYEKKIALKNCGYIDPTDIHHYIARGGYSALAKALGMPQEEIISQIKQSGLRGRGGAGFPTGQKWQLCRDAPGTEKYVICNADEGDPGAFMDRVILESDPHSVIEGMAIAAIGIGATHGYVYCRAEKPMAAERIGIAIDQARKLNLLGTNILGSGSSFDITLFRGAGAFVCGEETALIASLEGKQGIPHNRPPYPASRGLKNKPTLINNVKTLTYIPHIISDGAEWFRSIGTESSSGTAVFALAGKVVNTGLAEVPMGTTLRQVIFEVGSGIPNNKSFKAVQIGGPSGGCLPESALDLPVDFDSLREAGAMMGSGGMVVLDEDDCMVEVARYFLEFTQRESCGKCTFCRLGTKQLLEMLTAITRGQGTPEDLDKLQQLALDIKEGSLCGLGKTAPNPILTTLRYFKDEYLAHVTEERCPARMCLDLTAYYIIPEKCERSCDACVGTCTVEAITSHPKKRYKIIDQQKCVKCRTCLDACPPQYQAVIKLSPKSEVPA